MNQSRTSSTGNTLIVTLITMAIVGGFVSLALQYTNSIGRNVQRSLLMRQAINIGDASTEMAFSAWRAICRTNQTKIFKRSAFDQEIPTPTPGNFPGVASYNLSNYGVYPADTNWNAKPGGTFHSSAHCRS
jgi:type II secretory pathway pseudopilin PulG